VIVGPSNCYNFEILKAARSWTFAPARRDGHPVAGMYVASINPPAHRSFRELAAGAPGVPEVLTLLEAGQFPPAEQRLAQLWEATLGAGSPSRPYTVILMALRAIALAAHADPKDQGRAICLWEAAQAEVPTLYHLDLAPFGRAGQLLESHRFGELSVPRGDKARVEAPPGSKVERPEIVRSSQQSPKARFKLASYGASRVVLDSIIDEQGTVRQPMVLDAQEGLRGFDLEGLDAVCAWRFKPARLAGEPVKVNYSLTINIVSSGPPKSRD